MRVLLLSSFFPPDTGGIETYAYNFAVALQTEGHYVKVVCGSREISEVPMQHEELYKGIPVVRYCAAPGPFVDWPKRFSSRYNQVEIGDEFDVVFILNVSGLEFAVSRFNKTPKVYIVPTVFHYASNYIVRHVDPSMKGDVQKIDRQITRIEKKAIPFIDFFVTLSKNVKDQFIEYYGVSPKKIKVIPPGIDLSRFMKKKKSLERPLFLRDKRVVLVVSRIAQDKNVLDAVKAFSLVKTKNAALVFIGPVVKDYFEKIKEFIRINKIKNVYFLGEKKDPENYYPLGDIFVLPSRVEAFGLVLVEAQTSGLPCIGFKRDGKETFTAVGEVVSNGENGFVVKTVEEMANKIDLLLNSDSLRKRFSKNALIHSKRYSYNRMVGLLVGIAEDLRGL